MDCHIGSQLTELQPFLDATDRLIRLIEQLKEDGITLKHLDLGGGLGVTILMKHLHIQVIMPLRY